MSAGLPLLVDLRGRVVVVVGAGPVAAAKLETLAPAVPAITVVAPEAVEAVTAAARDGALRWECRPYADGDLAGAHLAVAATADATVNDAVAAEADRRGILCVRADAGGSAAFMGTVRRGPLTLAVATGTPALTRRVRQELAEAYGEEHGALAGLLADLRADPVVRAALAAVGGPERAARWRSILDTDILRIIRSGRLDLAKEVALACLSSPSG